MTYEKKELSRIALTNGKADFNTALLVFEEMIRDDDSVYSITLWNQWDVRQDWNSTVKRNMQARGLQEIGRLTLQGFKMHELTKVNDYFQLT